MRLEEIAQLDPWSDLRQEAEVWVFDVNQANGKQLKNKWSKRLVPIHRALCAQGLRSYVDGISAAGGKQLFPDTPMFEGRAGKNAGKTVNRFIQETVGVKGKTLHCFRHTVATALKQARVDEGIAAALLGQKHGGITYTRYGKDHLVQVVESECMPHISYGIEGEKPKPR